MSKFITDDIEYSSDYSDRENSGEGNSNEENQTYKCFRENIRNFLILEVRKFYFLKYKKSFISGLYRFPPEI